ncbi:hypothetical protein [Magnetospira sp. QH-2]|uniref:hypothetical protein n=1 Tax=Magnetospira sp. (strain QH-2) TaxID=1288970 RepID=UPI0003E812BE|nr:hypothetical protein [Magnetospira sp. QH-2]CCQ72317.1 protein of unknown function [Magnetospira sp. QH-2]
MGSTEQSAMPETKSPAAAAPDLSPPSSPALAPAPAFTAYSPDDGPLGNQSPGLGGGNDWLAPSSNQASVSPDIAESLALAKPKTPQPATGDPSQSENNRWATQQLEKMAKEKSKPTVQPVGSQEDYKTDFRKSPVTAQAVADEIVACKDPLDWSCTENQKVMTAPGYFKDGHPKNDIVRPKVDQWFKNTFPGTVDLSGGQSARAVADSDPDSRRKVDDHINAGKGLRPAATGAVGDTLQGSVQGDLIGGSGADDLSGSGSAQPSGLLSSTSEAFVDGLLQLHPDSLKAHNPNLREKWHAGLMDLSMKAGLDKHQARDLADRIVGRSDGSGKNPLPLVDFTPAGVATAVNEALHDFKKGDWIQGGVTAVATIPGLGAAAKQANKGLRNALANAPQGRSKQSNSLAQNRPNIYNPPSGTTRPFEADYPNGAKTDEQGNLTHDIDGRKLETDGRTVGRKVYQGDDQALRSTELGPIATEATGRAPRYAAKGEIGRIFGQTVIDANTRKPRCVLLSESLLPEDLPKVYAHEVGHVIDQAAGEIPVKGLEDELGNLYHTLNAPERAGEFPAPGQPRFTPERHGYDGDDPPRELMTEAIRAYMADPAYLKTVAPKTAKAIRAAVNGNPALRKIIQFNSAAGLAALGADDDED